MQRNREKKSNEPTIVVGTAEFPHLWSFNDVKIDGSSEVLNTPNSPVKRCGATTWISTESPLTCFGKDTKMYINNEFEVLRRDVLNHIRDLDSMSQPDVVPELKEEQFYLKLLGKVVEPEGKMICR